MKSRIAFFLSLLLILAQCGSDENQNPAAEKDDCICVWDNAPITDKPVKSGKWLAAAALGEKFKYLGNTEEETINGKKTSYYEIEYKDHEKGWIRADFAALAARPTVFKERTEIYSRPNLTSLTNKTFEPMDIVAVTKVDDLWLEVKGKRKNGKWIESGWVKGTSNSYNETDIAAAVHFKRAMAKGKKEDR
jgi:hypothetical protein